MEWSPRARSNCTLQRCVRARARAPAVGYLQSCSGLMQETQFDTSAAEITCVQTVIALQTIRTAITHFLKVNTLKQRGSARPEITLQKTHQGEPRGETGGEGEDREKSWVSDSQQPGRPGFGPPLYFLYFCPTLFLRVSPFPDVKLLSKCRIYLLNISTFFDEKLQNVKNKKTPTQSQVPTQPGRGSTCNSNYVENAQNCILYQLCS